ncbi:MAG: hypothetical protein ACTSSM_11210 [Promethearchaeota archaeon]
MKSINNNKNLKTESKIIYTLNKIITIEQFLKKYAEDINQNNLDDVFKLKFELNKKRTSSKIETFIRKASVKDAPVIANLFKEVYKGTYPYKHLEDKRNIANMLNNNDTEWILYETKGNKIAGGIGANLDFNLKKCLLYGFCILEPYRHIIDSLKATIGSLIYFWIKYSKKISIWYLEVRTYTPSLQWGASLCSLKPLAFFPNKDFFFNEIESEFLCVTYQSINFLKNHRSENIPKLIWPTLGAYAYSNKIYKLGEFKVENPQIKFNKTFINKLENSIKIEKKIDEYNNIIVNYYLKDSYFQFFHNKYSQCIENTTYSVSSLEELQAFINYLKKYITQNNVNYFQCFVSAYKPTHQQIFYENGFSPRGYIPCWKYNKNTKLFDDYIVFNSYQGSISKKIKLVNETRKLLKNIGLYNELERRELLELLKT